MHDFIFYFASRGVKSQDDYHAITPVFDDIVVLRLFLSKGNKVSGKTPAQEFHLFISVYYFTYTVEEKQICFVKSSDSEIKKLVANAVPESTQKSTKYTVNIFGGEESYA